VLMCQQNAGCRLAAETRVQRSPKTYPLVDNRRKIRGYHSPSSGRK
jgi:hypothetical protein